MNDREKIYWVVWPNSEISRFHSTVLVWAFWWSFWLHFPSGGSHLHYVSWAWAKSCCLDVWFHQRLLTHEEKHGDFCLCYKCWCLLTTGSSISAGCVYIFFIFNSGELQLWGGESVNDVSYCQGLWHTPGSLSAVCISVKGRPHWNWVLAFCCYCCLPQLRRFPPTGDDRMEKMVTLL